MEEEGILPIRLFPFYFDFHYWNVQKDPLVLDTSNFAFNFTKYNDDTPIIYLNLPVIKHWNCTFDYEYNIYGIPFSGRMELELMDATGVAALSLKKDDDGKFAADLFDFNVDFGYSEIYMESGWM